MGKYRIAVVVTIIVLAGLGFGGSYLLARKTKIAKVKEDKASLVQPTPVTEKIVVNQLVSPIYKGTLPTIVYEESISHNEKNPRTIFPYDMLVYRKVGKYPAEEIFRINMVSEVDGLTRIKISPDNRKLLFHISGYLKLFDLETKTMTDLLKVDPMGSYYFNYLFSPSSQEVLFQDQNGLSRIRLVDKQVDSVEIEEGSLSGDIYRWVKGDKVLIYQATGHGGFLSILDLSSKKIGEIPNSSKLLVRGEFSSDGTWLANPKGSVANPCNELDGAAEAGFEIIKIPENKVVDKVLYKDKEVEVITFSDDNTKVLFSVYDQITNQNYEECDKSRAEQKNSLRFFVREIGQRTSEVTDIKEVATSWQKASLLLGSGSRYYGNFDVSGNVESFDFDGERISKSNGAKSLSVHFTYFYNY